MWAASPWKGFLEGMKKPQSPPPRYKKPHLRGFYFNRTEIEKIFDEQVRKSEIDAAVKEGADRIGCGWPIMACMYQSIVAGTLEITPTFHASILAAWADQHR